VQALCFLPSGALVGVGFNYTPLLFVQQPHSLGVYSDGAPLESADARPAPDGATSAVSAAMRMFQAHDKAGQEQAVSQSAKLSSVHQNCVTSVRPFEGNVQGKAIEFTTSGLDGCLVFWTSEEMSAAMALALAAKVHS
jgi:actin related protein 2/3 complex subunit 1A/1B